VIDALIAPRRSAFVGAVTPKLHLSGFYLEDKRFNPIKIDARDPRPVAAYD
jgi:hypothetical protein